MTGSNIASHLRLVPDRPEELPDTGLKLTEESEENFVEEELFKGRPFVMIGTESLAELAKLVADKALMWRDIGILLTMIQLTDWRNGKCRATMAGIAEETGCNQSVVIHSVSRLKKAKIIAPAREIKTRVKVHLINPRLVKYGTGKRRGYLIRKFAEAAFANSPTDILV